MPHARLAISRRRALQLGSAAVCAGFSIHSVRGDEQRPGFVVGEATATKVGEQVLSDGGNAVDAIVAAALAGAVAAPHQTGPGGYGMTAVVAMNGRQIAAIDGNSTAPAAMTRDFFKTDSQGRVPGRANHTGWLAAGVPGVLAGLQKLLDEFGTRNFGELAQPAIRIAREGFPWPQNLATMTKARGVLRSDAGSRSLFFPNGEPLQPGEQFRNTALADMLSTLAAANSVASFYRGSIARQIADAFAREGGLVTIQDLAAYEARVVEPLSLKWDDQTIHTVPLTAGGISPLQVLRALHVMDWARMPADITRILAKIEATRLAWRDRLTLLGDPTKADVPVAKLLSDAYARESADKILAAVKARQPLEHRVAANGQNGTIHLSAGDRAGNLVALTLTHGDAFGSGVTVGELGLTLGHGMSRFDTHPDHPNSPGPGKRPLHNMCPSIATRDGRAVLAIGGAGGRRIPNSVLDVLTHFVALRQPLAKSMAAPRLHTEGTKSLTLQSSWPESDIAALRDIGYQVTIGAGARISAVAWEDGRLTKESS